MDYDRRRLLRLGGVAAVATLAGCSTGEDDGDDDSSEGTDAGASGGANDSGDGSGDGSSDGDESDGTDDDTAGETTDQFDYGGWLADTGNFDGTTVDARGSGSVRIDVGASANGGAFGFAPPAIWVDPGTEVVWEWTGDGGPHNVVTESGADFRSGDPTGESGTTFSQTFDEEGTVTYFCNPHRGMGMKGAVVVGNAEPGGGADAGSAYGFQAASTDAYWYSLYNMSTNVAMSGNGVLFPANESQRETFQQRMQGITMAADVDSPPVANPNLNMAPFTEGDPHFTQQPVLENEAGKPDASTLQWDRSASSGVVSPASLAWTHLKGVTWAKNFQNHFDVLPTDSIAPKFRSQVLTTLAQLGVRFSLVEGNLRANQETMQLVAGFAPGEGVVEEGPRLLDHSAMLWFLSDLVSLAEGEWFGYVNPEPLIPAENLQTMADGLARTTMNAFPAGDVLQTGSTRDVGELLGGVGWYGTHAGSDELETAAGDYADALAGVIEDAMDGDGRVAQGGPNQAATQGVVAQGLLWASRIDGVDHTDTAETVLGYLLEDLWDEDAGTFASSAGADVYEITARDAGDITGGLNAADAVLGTSGVRATFARFFDQTFNRGRLQRAERGPSRDESAEHTLPLPPAAGGEFGQSAVYNAAVEYDTAAEEWSVTDDRFDTAGALYLANQDVWVGNWAGDFYQGRGVPGESDTPE